MGVHGLWRLIEPSGKPVPLETLDNKVLAVDVSIWLHQIVRGFQDARGGSVPHAHLLGIYHRVCKLLYFRIKPVFVFDGGVPVLKRNTIALRNQQKLRNQSEADRIHKNLLSALVKHSAISKVLSEKAKAAITASTSPTKKSKPEEDDLYVLPPSQLDSTVSDEESSDDGAHPSRRFDLHSIDTQSVEFKSLPVDLRHEILTDLKETRKQSSWGRIHELPVESDDFATYQMKRLLKRQSVQSALEDVEKEMGGHSLSLGELEQLLKDQGVITNLKGSRIASDENTRFLLIKDIKQAVEDAKKQNLAPIEETDEEGKNCVEVEEENEDEKAKNLGEIEFEDDLKRAIALSLEEVPSTSTEQPSTSSKVKKIGAKGKNRMPLSFLADFEDADFGDSEESEEETVPLRLTPAQRYMMEYSGLTPHEIAKIIASKSRVSTKINLQKEKEVSVRPAESTSDENSIKPGENKTVTSEEEIRSTTEENNEAEEVTTSNLDEADVIEVISDSESSCDDFVDVEANKEKSMQVVIKPDEEIEDDLFKDVFAEEATEATTVSSTQDKVIEKFVSQSVEESPAEAPTVTKEKEKIGPTEASTVTKEKEKIGPTEASTVTKEKETIEDSKSTSEFLKDQIEKMIQNYSKPKEKKDESYGLSTEQLNEMQENLRKEQAELVAQRSSKERLAGNITDQMYQEAQELLELFGVPYLIAPMEAEAQCAFLELIGLTDGTITDDSDIWLFGGRTVYKNFFDQSKLVMEFRAENIHQHYKLTREQMILLAMLVGSDYTTGLTGVGPVTALEILAAFPPKSQLLSGLAEFKSWFTKGKLPGPGRTSLRGKLKNLSFTENFPNPQIMDAYLEPKVEPSGEKFTWGKPDVVGLVEFARQKFGWTKTKTEEILQPILRRLNENRSQKSITDYFRFEVKIDSGETAKKMSKRVKTAINKIGKGIGDEEEEEVEKPVRKKKKGEDLSGEPILKKRVSKKKKEEDEEIQILKETSAKSKKRVEEIEKEVHEGIEEQKKKKVSLQVLHKKEVIPQKQKEKTDILKNKMKAIEIFRRSKQGPGYVKKRGKVSREPQQDAAYLSESSNSD